MCTNRRVLQYVAYRRCILLARLITRQSVSAAHQALSISSYLNRMTIATSQAMTLIYFFLINDNHVSDAWTFSGITLRQGYVLQLNRNPEVVVPTASLEEKRLRIRLWTVISIQDTGLALNLKLPPCATVCDITPQTFRYYESMLDHESQTPTINDVFTSGSYPRGMDEMDSKYLSAFWTLSILVAEHICKPRALAKPICRSREHQRDIINQFYEAYNQIPAPYGTLDPERFYHSDERRSRQQICLCSNFFQYVMLVAADDNREDGVPPDYFITLEAAHEGLQGFFALFNRFGNETNGWWAYQHRAFEQAVGFYSSPTSCTPMLTFAHSLQLQACSPTRPSCPRQRGPVGMRRQRCTTSSCRPSATCTGCWR